VADAEVLNEGCQLYVSEWGEGRHVVSLTESTGRHVGL